MKKVLMLAAAVAFCAPAFAQVTQPVPAPAAAPADATFVKADVDKSGALSLAELKTIDVKITQADVDKYDADKSASISKAEFAKWQAAAAKPAVPAPTGGG